jgi:ABC-type branched-subunit amino acid transport system permease subunit
LLVGAVMDGIRSVWGALICRFLVLYIPNSLPPSLALMPIGFMALAVVFFMPDGVMGLFMRTYRRYANRKKHG